MCRKQYLEFAKQEFTVRSTQAWLSALCAKHIVGLTVVYSPPPLLSPAFLSAVGERGVLVRGIPAAEEDELVDAHDRAAAGAAAVLRQVRGDGRARPSERVGAASSEIQRCARNFPFAPSDSLLSPCTYDGHCSETARLDNALENPDAVNRSQIMNWVDDITNEVELLVLNDAFPRFMQSPNFQTFLHSVEAAKKMKPKLPAY